MWPIAGSEWDIIVFKSTLWRQIEKLLFSQTESEWPKRSRIPLFSVKKKKNILKSPEKQSSGGGPHWKGKCVCVSGSKQMSVQGVRLYPN